MVLWLVESFPALILVLSFIGFSFPRSHRKALPRLLNVRFAVVNSLGGLDQRNFRPLSLTAQSHRQNRSWFSKYFSRGRETH